MKSNETTVLPGDGVIEILDPVAQMKKDLVESKPPILYKLYKLRCKSTGLYSTGGSWVTWTTKGKVWNSLKGLSGHLAMHTGSVYNGRWNQSGIPWDDIEIVVLEVRENETDKIEATAYVQGMKERRAKREVIKVKQKAKSQLQAAQREFERAKKIVDDFQAKHGA